MALRALLAMSVFTANQVAWPVAGALSFGLR